MERLNSGELKIVFRNMSHIVLIGLTTSGRRAWQEEEEETRKDTSIALIRQEQSCTSEVFKVIQEAILLILLYKTMLLFRATSSSTLIMSDVQSTYIPLSIRDWYLEVKFWTIDRQYSFCRWIPWTKHKDPDTIDLNAPRHAQYMHKRGRDIRTQCIRSTSILLWSKDSSSIRHDRTPSSFMTHFQLIVFRKLLGWNWSSHTRESICVTSATSQDLLETWLDEWIGFRSCSTTGWTSCAAIHKFAINPTKSKPRSWQNGATRFWN